MISKLFLTLISTIIFGIIDSSFFLFAEEKIQKPIKKFKFFDNTTAELMTGGISTALAIMIASIIEDYILHYYKNLIKHPLLDALGVLIGTFIIIILYKLFMKKKNEENNK
tara:strand:+ start:459 stop:791 length:333 start_codon:yes stop_codon:yes gene_type:complete